MSTTALSMKMSLSPTNCRTVPEASVLTMTLGTPSGSARIADGGDRGAGRAAEAEHAAQLPGFECRRAHRAAPAAASVTASPRSARCRTSSRLVPASSKMRSRGMSASNGRVAERTRRRRGSPARSRISAPTGRNRLPRPWCRAWRRGRRTACGVTGSNELGTVRAVEPPEELKYSPTLLCEITFARSPRAHDADQRPDCPAESRCACFIRSGPKSHGPGAHDHPRFLKEWVPLLNAHGARATGADAFPTKAQLDDTDVLILHAQEAGNIHGSRRAEEPRRVPRPRRRAGHDPRRLGVARS